MSFDPAVAEASTRYAVRVNDVSKHYFIYERPEDRLKQMILPRFQRMSGREPQRYYHDFPALSGISFELKRGETVGIVGRNGAGKSTLLQIICGTLAPTSGTAEVNGRVGALLELGSGFNPEFSGRENVFLNAAILGLSREETEARFDSIAAFADIGEFIDFPVKTYSSGMYVRLAFAVQAQIDPDVLIVDEALAVGDARFQAKCFGRLRELRDRGTSILFVTHATEQVVTHCDRAILLEGGRKVDDGEPRAVVNRYLDLLYGRPAVQPSDVPAPSGPVPNGAVTVSLDEPLGNFDPDFATRAEPLFETRPSYSKHEYRWGDRRAEIMDYVLFADGVPFPNMIPSGSRIAVYVRYRFIERIVRPIFVFTLKTKEGITVYGTTSGIGKVSGVLPEAAPGLHAIVRFETNLPCGLGDYFLSVGVGSPDLNGEMVPHDRRYDSIHLSVIQEPNFRGLCNFGGTLEIRTGGDGSRSE